VSVYPVSIKGVLFVNGKVLLVRNDRNEWELPGGRMEPGETQEQTLVREFREELSIDVEPVSLIDSYEFEVIPSRYVRIVTYGCRLRGEFAPRTSNEHTACALHLPAELAQIPLPASYARSINSWSTHAES
jgi:mutator protein MutT